MDCRRFSPILHDVKEVPFDGAVPQMLFMAIEDEENRVQLGFAVAGLPTLLDQIVVVNHTQLRSLLHIPTPTLPLKRNHLQLHTNRLEVGLRVIVVRDAKTMVFEELTKCPLVAGSSIARFLSTSTIVVYLVEKCRVW